MMPDTNELSEMLQNFKTGQKAGLLYNNLVMIKVNVQDAKTNLSRYLDAVEKGEVVVLCRHNKPIAELRAVTEEPEQTRVRKFGLWDGFGVSESFFETLPDDILKAFNGE